MENKFLDFLESQRCYGRRIITNPDEMHRIRVTPHESFTFVKSGWTTDDRDSFDVLKSIFITDNKTKKMLEGTTEELFSTRFRRWYTTDYKFNKIPYKILLYALDDHFIRNSCFDNIGEKNFVHSENRKESCFDNYYTKYVDKAFERHIGLANTNAKIIQYNKLHKALLTYYPTSIAIIRRTEYFDINIYTMR